MAALSEIFVKKETLETLLSVLSKKTGDDAKGIKITISLSDEAKSYGQNVSAYVSQTKEQRDAKKPIFYVGNGKTFWTKGETPIPKKETKEKSKTSNSEDNEPF